VTIVPRAVSLAVAVVLLAACGGSEKAASGQGSTASTNRGGAGTGASTPGGVAASATTVQDEKSATPPLSLKSFMSPSGNIGCMLEADDARCDVRQHIYTTGVKPASCNLDWGDSLQVSDRGVVEWLCHGDTVVEPGAPVLAYGTSSRQGSITCISADTGVTCTRRPGGHGFLISRERYRIF
jgi:hypothetical protein